MANAYPEKQIVPYQRTSIEVPIIVEYLKSLPLNAEIKRMAYIMFRNESSNGKSGINNNYFGFQADAGRWPSEFDNKINGVVSKNENRTGKTRLFLSFNSYKDSIDFVINRIEARQLYVGGHPQKYAKFEIKDSNDLSRAYYKEWVIGDSKYEPTESESSSFKSMYKQATSIFPLSAN